jgi:putative transposase
VKYRFIQPLVGVYSLRLMCRVLEVSVQGYYKWLESSKKRAGRQEQDRVLGSRLRAIHASTRRVYGRVRLTRELCARGEFVNEKRVRRIMKLEGLQAKATRRFKATTDSEHRHPVWPNELARDFKADSPNEKWVGDITYIRTDEGWLYLAVILDLYSRRVIGWALRDRMTSELVCDALQMAVKIRGVSAPVLCHFDRGSQYAGGLFQALLRRYDLRCSMSRRANCWDNAVAESFFHSLKVEAIYGERFTSKEQARTAIFDWIECFYNTTRRHSSLNYLSPADFEMRVAG